MIAPLGAMPGIGPTERVLAGMRSRPLGEPGNPATFIAPLAGPIAEMPFTTPVGTAGTPGFSPGPTPFFGGGGGVGGGGAPVVLPGTGGPVTGGGTPTPTPTPTPVVPIVPVVSVIPEPGTWLMMIAGFLSIGIGLRVRNERVPAARHTRLSPATKIAH